MTDHSGFHTFEQRESGLRGCVCGLPDWDSRHQQLDPSEYRDGSREGDQAPPEVNDHPIIQELVQRDLEDRLQLGVKRYGSGLQPHNGRDMLKDAYDEAMDLVVYLRGCLYERDGR